MDGKHNCGVIEDYDTAECVCFLMDMSIIVLKYISKQGMYLWNIIVSVELSFAQYNHGQSCR